MAAKKNATGSRPHSTLTSEARAMLGGQPRPTPKAATAGSLLRRRVAPGEVERLALWLHSDVLLALKTRAAAERMNLSAAVERALRAWLEAGGK